jgi:ABC-2 type transport system permease protein
MNPVIAKITPQLLKSFMPKGMNITITEPTAADSWAQFYKNIPQMGLIVLVIVFSGIMSHEFSRGTLVNMLTKGLSRSTVILSKLTMAASVWTISYAICFGVTYGYTLYFWGSDNVRNVFFSAFCLWLFGILLLATIILGGVLFRNSYGSLLFTGGLIVVLLLINIVPELKKYNPVKLASGNMDLINGSKTISDFIAPAAVCSFLIVVFIEAAIKLFNKKQIS